MTATRRTARNVARQVVGALTSLQDYVVKHGDTKERERIKRLLVEARRMLAAELRDERDERARAA